MKKNTYKINPRIVVRNIEDPKDFEKGRVLLYKELGSFFRRENFISKIKENKSIMQDILYENRVIGASFAYSNESIAKEFFKKAPLLETKNPKDCLFISGIAVNKRFRKKGFGTNLFKQRERIAKNLGYLYLLGESWLESPSPSRNLLISQGMKEIKAVENNWKNNYPIPDLCPRCGDICYCTAILFWKKL